MPTPNTSTANGINATEGTGRKNSIVEFVNLRRNGDEPMIKPSTAAETTAISIPKNQATMVSHTATQNTGSPNLVNKSAMASDAGGINRPSTTPNRGSNSQMPKNSKIPTSPNNRLAQVRRRWRTARARPVLVRRPVAPRWATDTAGAPGSGRVDVSSPATRYPAGKSSGARPVSNRCKSCVCRCRVTASSSDGAGPLEGSRSLMCSLHYVCKLNLMCAAFPTTALGVKYATLNNNNPGINMIQVLNYFVDKGLFESPGSSNDSQKISVRPECLGSKV